MPTLFSSHCACIYKHIQHIVGPAGYQARNYKFEPVQSATELIIESLSLINFFLFWLKSIKSEMNSEGLGWTMPDYQPYSKGSPMAVLHRYDQNGLLLEKSTSINP